jgi:hypothetical protein
VTPAVRRGSSAVVGVLVAMVLVAGLHADGVAWLRTRAALHRAAVAGVRAVGPAAGPSGALRVDPAPEGTVRAAAQAAWSSESPAVRATGTPRFVVRAAQHDGWPIVEVEAAMAVELPWGLAFWLADGPVIRVRGAGRR